MIPYTKTFLGLNLIFRINGSPLYRAAIPGLISVGFYTFLKRYYPQEDYLEHPYGVGVLVSSVSFLIVFRANYGYQRYWAACGDVHQCMSKWLDAATHTGVFHMQQKHYDHIKPPSYFDHHDLNKHNLRRDRERETDSVRPTSRLTKRLRKNRTVAKSIHRVENLNNTGGRGKKKFKIMGGKKKSTNDKPEEPEESFHSIYRGAISDKHYMIEDGRLDGGWGALFGDGKGTFYDMNSPETWNDKQGFASTVGGRTPNLFLQELTHLASLLLAVAFSTLRCDVEGTEAPLDFYRPGEPWPEVDPDQLRKGTGKPFKHVFETLRYVCGMDKSIEMRAAQNANRPLQVIGGVSANEIAFLQRARGPSAKVTLAWHWLSEFIMREHLAGSLGNIGPPIVSRLIQFLSDGMIYYNHARKTMFIPFPFPHAQISAFFVYTIMFAVPILMDEFANEFYLGGVLTFLTVTALAGMHEVARELENPFRNVPNDIPLNTLLAMYNESLITLYSGFHPDHYWDADNYKGTEVDSPAHTTSSTSISDLTPKSSSSKNKSQPSSRRQERPQSVASTNKTDLIALLEKQEEDIKQLRMLVEADTEADSKVSNGSKSWKIF